MDTSMRLGLNERAQRVCEHVADHGELYRVAKHALPNGATVLDFGVHTAGGIQAGVMLARICMADSAEITIEAAENSLFPAPRIQVTSDRPIAACMASQYAGWPIKSESFFAMGSGPMRAKRGKEHVLQALKIVDAGSVAIGVLECDTLPDEAVCESIATECGVALRNLTLCVAPTRSIAGTLQVVARSVETSLHKLFELGFDLNAIVSAHGTAPLPPPAKDFVEGIGRTNDAILYGGHVSLWVDCDDDIIESTGPRVPSQSSKDYGRPFAEIFKNYHYDFYQVDPGLFSPAMISISNLRTGHSWRWGQFRSDLLDQSFRNRVATH